MPFILAQPQLEKAPPYVVFDKHFTLEECDRIIALHRVTEMKPAEIGDGTVDPEIRTTEIGWVPWNDSQNWLYGKLAQVCQSVQSNWYPFILAGFVESLQLTHYRAENSGHYEMHRDMGTRQMSCRKLSLVVQLSEPDSYEGGNLEILGIPGAEKRVSETHRGTVIAFPAYELHRVTRLTKGERWSLVAWVHGPPFA